MLRILIKCLIFIIVTQSLNLIIALEVKASVTSEEVYLKQLSGRVREVLRDSYEAQVFLGEDLTHALQVLDSSKIEWVDHGASIPLLFDDVEGHRILLGKSLPLNTSSIVTILFQIKRQLEASVLPIPEYRISLFAKKFSLLGTQEVNSCDLSLYPFPKNLPVKQRENLLKNLLSLLQSLGHGQSAEWGKKVIWFQAEEMSDAECGGQNRNVFIIVARILDMETKLSSQLAQVKSTTCGYKAINKDKAIQKLLKKIKSNLSRCN